MAPPTNKGGQNALPCTLLDIRTGATPAVAGTLRSMKLRASTDRKTAPTATASANVNVRNAFGLLSGREYSCPGATDACLDVCYAGRLEQVYKGFRDVVEGNFNALRTMTEDQMVDALAAMLRDDFIADLAKRTIAADTPRIFRIHHDGDFFSRAYASAWARVCRMFPDIQFWVYTRSFVPALDVTDLLAGIDNLSVYLSIDKNNQRHAARPLLDYGFKPATMAQTFDEARGLTDLPVTNCPELNGAIPLITSDGGACKTCGLCVWDRRGVAFSTTGK